MPLTRLTLTDFRSYAAAALSPGPGFVVLTGDNGAGKTNILEAISLLAPGRGLRGSTLGEMAHKGGAGGFSVSASLSPSRLREGLGVGTIDFSLPQPLPQAGGEVSLGTGTRATTPERRIVRVQGATASATALAEWLSIVWLTPAQDRLFSGTPGERRRFLDRLVLALDPGHARHSARYEAAMRQRNRLLAEGRPDPEWLAALETAMEDHGAEIERARMQAAIAITTAQASAPFPQFRLMIQSAGRINAKRLAASRGAHAAAGRTLIGPHTDDLSVDYLAKAQPAAQSSTGEQKALLLGIVLAHADLVAERAGRRPILLLDEVAAHLDPSRRAALFERLDGGGGQVWLTGTEPALFDAVPASATHFSVANATAMRCDPGAA